MNPRSANYFYPTQESDNPVSQDSNFEFDESDVWNSDSISSFESKKTMPASRPSKKLGGRRNLDHHLMTMDRSGRVKCASSLPVNIPDWSKIYRAEQREHQKMMMVDCNFVDDHDTDFDDDHGHDPDDRVPPHEYLARQRGESFSVHEGIGRTLKGRDLRQVRNAIWKRVGFED